MKKMNKKTVRIIAMVVAVAAISALLIRPRTIYSMAESAIELRNYEAAFSLLERTDDPRGEELSKTLLFAPLRSETVYGDGTVVLENYVYDENSVLLRTETNDPRLGDMLVEVYEYDEFGRMLSSKQTQDGSDLLNTEQCTYDDRGNLLTSVVSDQTGELYRTVSTYDFENRLLTKRTEYTTGEWSQMAYVYDEMGQVLSEKKTDSIPEEAYTYTYEYYDFELIKTRTVETIFETTKTTFDEMGVTIGKEITLADGTRRVGEYHYREDGLLEKVTYNDGEVTEFVYDEDGNQIERYDTAATGEKTVTLQEFNNKGKVAKRSVDENGLNRYSYTYEYGKRNLVTFREYQNETDGTWYRYKFTFDRFGNLVTEIYEGPDGSYTRTIEWEIRYAPYGIPVSIQNSAKKCRATKEY